MRNAVVFVCSVVALGLGWSGSVVGQPTLPVDYAVQVTASVQSSPPQIQLAWPKGRFDTSYTVSRKLLEERQWSRLAELPASATGYTDNNVVVGRGYEYQIVKTTSRGFAGYGYIYAGIELPLVENRGKVIVLVQSTHAQPLNEELSRLTQDLAGDGWQVIQVSVRPDIRVTEVKSVVRAIYNSDPAQVKALFIVGHVPVPYSGNIFPDDHVHQGAWPADVYYADMTGQWDWTDFVINLRTRNYPANRNIPDDRKFDQSYPPAADLQVGRVDFWNLPVFGERTELSLLRQYLDKNHRFRHGELAVPRRGLIADFLPKGHVPSHSDGDADPVGNSGWRNFSAFFGPENIQEVDVNEYLPVTSRESFLWSFGGSVSREFNATDAIARSADFAAQDVNVVFTMFVGGFYGDWNTPDNLLRAALGSGNVLTASYSGLPHWQYQHMALGETIGLSTRLTQLNRRGGVYPPFNDGAGQVHIALMGDPTLRLHPVLPPANLTAAASGNGVELSWTPSRDRTLLGYHLYRASSPQGPFQRISGNELVRGTSFRDSAPSGSATYMVRAVKLELSASGTYYNASQGIFATVPAEPGAPASPSDLQAQALSGSEILLTWTDQAHNEAGFRVDRATDGQNFTQLASLNADVTAYVDRERTPQSEYSYRVSAFNATGTSRPSNTAQATTLPSPLPEPPSSARFAQTDSQTRGNWTGRYGTEGYYVVTKEDVTPHGAGSIWPSDPIIPTYSVVKPIGKQTYIWSNFEPAAVGLRSVVVHAAGRNIRLLHDDDHVEVFPITTDPRALQREPGSTERLASAWYASEKFSVEISVSDPEPRRVSFYFLDWDRAGRSQTIQVFGRDQLLDTRTVSNFQDGVYYSWDVRGPVRFDFTKVSGPNALIMGMFFDPVGGPVDPPPPVIPPPVTPPPVTPPPVTPPPVSTPPAAPSNLAASALSASEIEVRWSDNSNNESGFRLVRRLVGTRVSEFINIPANTTSYTDRGLTSNSEYVYQIYALNEAGLSAASGLSYARTLGGAPVGPLVELRVERLSATQAALRVEATSGLSWVVESSTNLVEWSPMAPSTSGSSYFEVDYQASGFRFYRVRAE